MGVVQLQIAALGVPGGVRLAVEDGDLGLGGVAEHRLPGVALTAVQHGLGTVTGLRAGQQLAGGVDEPLAAAEVVAGDEDLAGLAVEPWR